MGSALPKGLVNCCDRLEVLRTNRKALGVTSLYIVSVFHGERDGNPEKKSPVGDDGLRNCLEEYGLDLSVVDDILRDLESGDTVERWLDAIPS